ncbi:phenylalanine ammonia-lyase [Aspergillus indologenus CBS 114.80]|uniref:Phenylalanine ammonia-lyase n=1 Tax=Aspergillus indologenus CBS 114.80 TaxID=1450541 RepID=A0A2V5IR11_9EURO|nr:phenylalanine ammonia-lyase [Aspergillus indologenus CBS 114.80]
MIGIDRLQQNAMANHTRRVCDNLRRLLGIRQSEDEVKVDGESLGIAELVSVARYSAKASIPQTEALMHRMQTSVDTLHRLLEQGKVIYGVNTGVGDNAYTRAKLLTTLQHSVFQHHQAGILLIDQDHSSASYGSVQHSLAEDIVRGMILVRCNSILRGHSGVRKEILDFLIAMLDKDILPLVPESGSISASGDLSPLSYLGGLIEGNPDTFVRIRESQSIQILSAAEALQQASLEPFKLQPKEGLGLMNGTAPSASAASLVVHDTHTLAILAQILTAMSTEALHGTLDNYHRFISDCRPHPGQREAARNIRAFLQDTQLCQTRTDQTEGLAQDRYDLRTAPQWIGPTLEDLLAADRQISIELNATTDNPLIQADADTYHQGGNFQATVLTSAMDKTRTSLLLLGKLLLAQCQQMVDPCLSNGLSPNLCVEDPHISFAAKGVEINMVAYCAELGFLANNSVVSHVHSAEMRNQSVNSLALLDARYATRCVELLSMMCAAHLWIACQALDLRVLQREFFRIARPACQASFNQVVDRDGPGKDRSREDLPHFDHVWSFLRGAWLERSRLSLRDRCAQASQDCLGYMVVRLAGADPSVRQEGWKLIQCWSDALPAILEDSYHKAYEDFSATTAITPQYLGRGTKPIYRFVREQLGVPFHRGVEDHPAFVQEPGELGKKTIGTHISRIYAALRNDEFAGPIVTLMEEFLLVDGVRA